MSHTISVSIVCWKYLGFLDCSLFAHVLQILMPGVQEEQVSYCRWMEGVNVPTAVSSDL